MTIQSLLTQHKIENRFIHWLPQRERWLFDRLSSYPVHPCNILLVNATKGHSYYASIIDFVRNLNRLHPKVRFISCSHFDDIAEFHKEVRQKGIPTLPIKALQNIASHKLNRFDAIIFVGPSMTMIDIMQRKDISSKLIMIDLAFYHQLIEATPLFVQGKPFVPQARHLQHIHCYTTQTPPKLRQDLQNAGFQMGASHWTLYPFPYIPLNFSYATYYQSTSQLFDVVFLGAKNRNYSSIPKKSLTNKKLLFIGDQKYIKEDFKELIQDLDITISPKLNEDDYRKMLSLCRCAVLPFFDFTLNSFCSIQDTFAMGIPTITNPHLGITEAYKTGAPLHLFHQEQKFDFIETTNFTQALEDALQNRTDIAHQQFALRYAQEQLDIYRMLDRIFCEQIFI